MALPMLAELEVELARGLGAPWLQPARATAESTTTLAAETARLRGEEGGLLRTCGA